MFKTERQNKYKWILKGLLHQLYNLVVSTSSLLQAWKGIPFKLVWQIESQVNNSIFNMETVLVVTEDIQWLIYPRGFDLTKYLKKQIGLCSYWKGHGQINYHDANSEGINRIQ